MRKLFWIVIGLVGGLTPCGATAQVVAWGDNTYGQTNVPSDLTNVVAIACGENYNLALRSNGKVTGWGQNSYNQRTPPASLSNVVAIAAGRSQSLALKHDGLVFGWGSGSPSQVPPGLSNVIAVAAGPNCSFGLTTEGRVVSWGQDPSALSSPSYPIFPPAGLSNVVGVVAGDWFGLAVTSDGKVTAWGIGYHWCHGQVGDLAFISNAVAVSGGDNHSLALKSDGTVIGWGVGAGAEVPAGLSNVVAIAAGAEHSLALRSDGTVVGWGLGSAAIVPPGLSNVVAISAGYRSSLALTGITAPTIVQQPLSRIVPGGETAVFRCASAGLPPPSYQWLFNDVPMANGERVQGANSAALIVKDTGTDDIGGYSVIVSNAGGAITSTVALLAPSAPISVALADALNTTNLHWGTDGNTRWFAQNTTTHDGVRALRSGALAHSATNWIHTSIVGPGVLSFWWRVSSESGYDFLRCFINNVGVAAISGEVGWNRQIIDLGTGTNIVQWRYDKDEAVKSGQDAAWLDEVAFTPGVSAPEILTQPSANNVLAGATGVFKVSARGTPLLRYQWFMDGTLVADTSSDTFTVTNVQVSKTGGYQVIITNDSGAATSAVVNLTVTSRAPVISREPKSRGVPRGWQLDIDPEVQGSEPLAFMWSKDGASLPGATNSTLHFPNFTDSDTATYQLIVTNIYGGATSAAAPLAISQVVAWGRNNSGQAEVPAFVTNVVAVSTKAEFNAVLQRDGTVAAWGYSAYGETNVPAGLSDAVALAAGRFHCLALRANGTVVAWGAGTNVGSLPHSGQSIVPPGLSNVVAIAAGYEHSLALRDDGTVVAWGRNSNNQSSVPPGLSNVVAMSAGVWYNLALRSDETLVTWGNDGTQYGMTNIPPGLGNAVAMASDYHNLVVKSDGTLVGWGRNSWGEANPPAGLNNVKAVAVGRERSLALRFDGTVFAWGHPDTPFFFVGGLSNVVAIASGLFHGLALIDDNSIPQQVSSISPALTHEGFSLQIPTQSGHVYRLEHTPSLTNPVWTPLPLVAGNGGLLTLTDPTAAAASARFYRVRCW